MYKRILVPIDGSPAAQRALAEALALAKDYQATVRLVHVIGLFIVTGSLAANRENGQIWKTLRDRGLRLLAEGEAMLRAHRVRNESAMVEIVRGRAADAIITEARKWRADLIVIGTHGRRGLSRLALGSEAEKVIRAAPVPVVVVRAGIRTPLGTSLRSGARRSGR